MKHTPALALSLTALAAVLVIAGCTAPPPVTGQPAGGGAAGGGVGATRIAPGLYDMPDGTVQAVGTLQWMDLEGGFWAVVTGSGSAGDTGTVVAVIANAAKDDPAYTALAGQVVTAAGARVEGVSIRQAGPEIDVTSLTAVSDTVDPAK